MLPAPASIVYSARRSGYWADLPVEKRLFDVVFAALVAVFLLSWLVPVLALLIKLETRGPVFFQQQRTGKDGRSFRCLKFRSMVSNADAVQATRGDARITRVGAFLRRTSLDEMPQFLNVLRGDMSIVGPRPHMLQHTEHYAGLIDNFMDRHAVRPGITGLAQVSGWRGETKETEAMAQRVRADLRYIARWSLLLDVQIVWATLVQSLTGNANAF